MIERKRGIYDGRNKSSAYKDLVWTVATSSDNSVGIEQQTKLTLDTIQANLIELGANPDHWPQRACLGVNLEGDVLIEITVTAVRK
jgi:enamine deaminase RidA (YjgF/YER057c/UK114 family)